jgi:chromosome segregation ATPase
MCHRYGSFSKVYSSNNNKNLKQSAYNLNPNYRYNPIHNSYEHQTNLEPFYSNKNFTLGADYNYDINNRFRKTTQKDNINKDQSTSYIKMIIPVVEGIRENQEKIINILQGYKQDKEIQEINNNKLQKENNNKKDNDQNKRDELLDIINKLNEDLGSMKEELSSLKKSDEENKKIIESNKIEIINLKNEIETKDNLNKNNIDEKDKKIKELEESLSKMKSEKQDMDNKKNREIENLKKELNQIKNTNIFAEKLNNMEKNIEILMNSVNCFKNNQNTLFTSTSVPLINNSEIISINDGKFKLTNPNNKKDE